MAPINVSLDYTTNRPLHELYTGQNDPALTRTYARYLENANVMVWEEFYNGNGVDHHFRNPYARKIPVDGTDGFQFSPKLGDEKQDIKYFDEFSMRPVTFSFDSDQSHSSLNTLQYKLKVNSLTSADYGDSFNCPMLNLSSVYETPLFVGLPQYSGCTPACLNP